MGLVVSRPSNLQDLYARCRVGPLPLIRQELFRSNFTLLSIHSVVAASLCHFDYSANIEPKYDVELAVVVNQQQLNPHYSLLVG